MNDTIQIQSQIHEINQKLDVLLGYMHEQKLKSTMVDDLVADLSIVGKDMYDTAVTELDNYSVELDPEQIKLLTVKLLKNIPTFIRLIDTMESVTDLARDAGPMVNEMIIDFTRKLHEFENRGYFNLLNNLANPKLFNALNKLLIAFNSIEMEQVPEYSYWQLLKELRKPEIKKSMAFMIIFMKNMGKA